MKIQIDKKYIDGYGDNTLESLLSASTLHDNENLKTKVDNLVEELMKRQSYTK